MILPLGPGLGHGFKAHKPARVPRSTKGHRAACLIFTKNGPDITLSLNLTHNVWPNSGHGLLSWRPLACTKPGQHDCHSQPC